MSEVIKYNKYLTYVKIPIEQIKKIDLLMAAQPREVMQSAFNRLGTKPDFMINGGLFNMSNGVTMSTTVDNGKKYAEGYFSNFGLWVNKDNMFGFGYYSPGTSLGDFIGGSPTLVVDSAIKLDAKGLDRGFLENRHPRSAIGLSDSSFYMIAVDGRRTWAPGMTCKELAQFMKTELSCRFAVNLDGGGSTRLGRSIDGKLNILNSPTENRSVDNFICVYLTRDKDMRVVTAYRLNIRKTPGGTILGTYESGAVVEVLETSSGWCRTEKGWVFEKYLRTI